VALLAGMTGIGLSARLIRRETLARESALRSARVLHERDLLRQIANRSINNRLHDPVSEIERLIGEVDLTESESRGVTTALSTLIDFARTLAREAAEGSDETERGHWGDLIRFGVPERVRWAPKPLHPSLLFAGRVLDEVRRRHTPEIEHAALVYTLSARAVLLALTPWLSKWSSVPSPLRSGSGGVAGWAAMTSWSGSIALSATDTAQLVMDRGPEGARTRRVLMWAEVPMATIGVILNPSWSVMSFCAGWTNYWQRPGPQFYPRRLIVFIAVAISSQVVGLRRARIRPLASVAEVAAGLTTIALIGDSYGAMLPLSTTVLLESAFSDVRLWARVNARASNTLSLAATEVQAVADRLRTADDAELRDIGDALAIQAEILARTRRAPRELEPLVRAALSRSTETFTVSIPTFASAALRARTLTTQTHAEVLAGAIRHCHAEANRHGLTRVTTDVRVRDTRQLVITIVNDIDPDTRHRSGSGGRILADLVRQLPDGELEERAEVQGDDVAEGMWRTRFSSVLDS
jgi:hypothetical protein